MNNLQEVTAELEIALSGISFEQLDISDEIQEQVPTVCVYCYILLNTEKACLAFLYAFVDVKFN